MSAGCRSESHLDKAAPPATPPSAATTADVADRALVRTVIAEHLQVNASTIGPETTFAQLGADELDLVEIVMELEDRLDVRIRDEDLAGPEGHSSAEVLDGVTVEKLAALVTRARSSPGAAAGSPDGGN